MHLSDTAIGFLTGTALAIFYTGLGIPLGLMADRINRRNLIAIAISIWSVMMAACGQANTFSQLLFARIGVGVGEAGGTPASQSMLSDLFPFSQRAWATSVFCVGRCRGIHARFDIRRRYQRCVRLAVGLPRLRTSRRRRRTIGAPDIARAGSGTYDVATSATAVPTLRDTLNYMRSQTALLHVLTGSTVAVFRGWGLLWWTPAFLARS